MKVRFCDGRQAKFSEVGTPRKKGVGTLRKEVGTLKGKGKRGRYYKRKGGKS